MRITTIGFTKKSAEQFFGFLRDAHVVRIVDIRLNNNSQLAGFAKKNDLAWFAKELCGVDYIHEPSLAPTNEMLSDYRAKRMSWTEYEKRFVDLMERRQIESVLSQDILDNGCLLCSEDQPHYCHRRIVAEYLQSHWLDVEVKHLGLTENGEPNSPTPNYSNSQAAPRTPLESE